jgi:NADPH-dependent 2,4-dienoyl-CoA reductase/sulfur reductase-like enzyme
MSRAVVPGAGIAGYTAASFPRRWLPAREVVTVESPEPTYVWVPSSIWARVGLTGRGR